MSTEEKIKVELHKADIQLDEYRLRGILEEQGVYSSELLTKLDEHLDKVLTVYLKDKEGHEKMFAVSVGYYLRAALMDSENSKCKLDDRIQEIIDGYDKIIKGGQ